MAVNGGNGSLREKQEQRRRRIISAALALGSEGGYDAVQMREIAEMADVALGTIYRYFSSKDHVLAAGLALWTGQFQDRLVQRPAEGDTAADQLTAILRRACRALERQPRLTGALVKAMTSSDPGVAESVSQVGDMITGWVGGVLVDFPEDVRSGIVDLLGHVWYSTLAQWANGLMPLEDVGDELERMVRLVVEPYDVTVRR
jgi:TetR/AcrR family transcriptional regulator, cholesterol catabolism regulator